MKFSEFAKFLQRLEETSSRNAMTEIFAELLKSADVGEVDKICYLTQGRVAPLFEPVEFGLADKMMIKAMAQSFEKKQEEVTSLFKKLGDLGKVAESLSKNKGENDLTVGGVFKTLLKVTQIEGNGSVEKKADLLADLLRQLSAISCRYIVRIPVGKLRLGFSDMTVLDSLSWMLVGSKKARVGIERAYNVRPDLGFIARVIREKGISGLEKVEPVVGTPIMMARGERLSSGKEIIEKIGKCAVEGKIDGFRVAVHKDGEKVRMFSRNMEETTLMYPDLVEGVLKQIKAEKVILEGEAIAYNPQTQEYLPFQETVQRKRKYDIKKMAEKVPLRLICFDCLYVNGESLLHKGYLERRKYLEKIVGSGDTLIVNKMEIVEDPERLEMIFQDAISRGLEGIFAKRLDGVYQAGARGWNWIKYKRSYQGKLEDTIDAVVMGYDYGQGKRSGFGIGDFLTGVYDKKADTFKTIAKIGTGLTDEEWQAMRKKCGERRTEKKPARYDADKIMECDVWVKPEMVVVIRADEITRSPVHTAGRTGKKLGFALRFPRLVNFRDDKIPEDTTTVKEIEDMFKSQLKRR